MSPIGFHTPTGYRDAAQKQLTASMEDYLEMICRAGDKSMHIGELATALHVRPSSATRMVQKLAEHGWLTYNPYDVVRPTLEGLRMGEYLLWRHEVLMRFFTALTGKISLEEVEQVEHFLCRETVQAVSVLTGHMEKTNWMQKDPE